MASGARATLQRLLTATIIATVLGGCGGYTLKNLVKSDVDLVADDFIDETRRLTLVIHAASSVFIPLPM